MDVFAQPYEAQIRVVLLQHPVAGTWYTSYDATVYPFGIVLPTQSLIPDPGILDDTCSLQQHPLHQGQKHHKARDEVASLVESNLLMAQDRSVANPVDGSASVPTLTVRVLRRTIAST